MLVSGATMGLRGGAAFACASPIKFALRSYCQSMSQSYHKEGVHIGHVVIDGVIDVVIVGSDAVGRRKVAHAQLHLLDDGASLRPAPAARCAGADAGAGVLGALHPPSGRRR